MGVPDTTWAWVAATLVAVLSTARLTKLLTEDNWPPARWVRDKWIARFQGDWGELVTCPFCAAPYIAAGVLAWGWFTEFQWAWWAFNGWLAVAYVAAIVVARDIPGGE